MKELENFYVIPGNEMEFQDYAYKHTDRLEKIGMVPRIVLLEYDWVRTMANHALQINAAQ